MQRHNLNLGDLAFFHGMDEPQLRAVAATGETMRFEPGEMLMRAGALAARFYLVRHGRVGIELDVPKRGVVSLQVIGEGDALGWSWLFEPYHWQFDARALEPTRVVAFDAHRLRQAMEADPMLGYALTRRLAQVMAQRLHAARIQLLDVYEMLT